MQLEPIIGVQSVAFLAHVAIVLQNRVTDQKLPDLTVSAASIGSVLYLLALAECASGMYSTLSMFPMLIPMIVTPMVASDLGRAIGMGVWLHFFAWANLSLSIYSIQLIYMIPERYPFLAVTSIVCLMMACASFAIQHRKANPSYSRSYLLLSCLILSLPITIQIFLPYLLHKGLLAVMLLAPILSSITLCSVAFALTTQTKRHVVQRAAVLHTMGVSLKRTSISVNEEKSQAAPPADDSSQRPVLPERSLSQTTSFTERKEPSLYSEGYVSDAGHDSGEDLTLMELSRDVQHDHQTGNEHLGRLVPPVLAFSPIM